MLSYLTAAMILGLSSGFAPGPLLTLMIAETLQHGRAAGVRVSVAPLITDTPIVILVLLLFTGIGHIEPIAGGIAVLGGGFVFYLGWSSIRIRPVTVATEGAGSGSLTKGVITNFLNPAPYLFWVGVGAPLLMGAYGENPVYAVVFVVTFYGLMVGSKILLAVITERSRGFLSGKVYLLIMRLLGVAMCGLAIGLVYDGWQLLSAQ